MCRLLSILTRRAAFACSPARLHRGCLRAAASVLFCALAFVILGANGTPAATFASRRQETLVPLRNFAIVDGAPPLHHGRTPMTGRPPNVHHDNDGQQQATAGNGNDNSDRNAVRNSGRDRIDIGIGDARVAARTRRIVGT